MTEAEKEDIINRINKLHLEEKQILTELSELSSKRRFIMHKISDLEYALKNSK